MKNNTMLILVCVILLLLSVLRLTFYRMKNSVYQKGQNLKL